MYNKNSATYELTRASALSRFERSIVKLQVGHGGDQVLNHAHLGRVDASVKRGHLGVELRFETIIHLRFISGLLIDEKEDAVSISRLVRRRAVCSSRASRLAPRSPSRRTAPLAPPDTPRSQPSPPQPPHAIAPSSLRSRSHPRVSRQSSRSSFNRSAQSFLHSRVFILTHLPSPRPRWPAPPSPRS